MNYLVKKIVFTACLIGIGAAGGGLLQAAEISAEQSALIQSLIDARVADLAPQANLDHVWTMVAAALVLLMQGGFLLLEAGLVRSKNSVNVAQKNIADLVLAIICFGGIGFMLMFGNSFGGFIGLQWDLFAFDSLSEWGFTFFVFQAVFCGTAATIVSGAVAERMKFGGYLVITVFIAIVIYPVFGHWAWGNLLNGDNPAYLGDKGFIDFAGSTVVHSIGGWVSLAGIVVIGARHGRFDANGKPVQIHGHSPVLATMGALILFVGWIGFNGGSTTAGTPAFAHIVSNTIIAAAFGGLASMFAGRLQDGLFRPDRSINGLLGGLVAITAGCDAVHTWGAIAIGFSGGLVAFYGAELLERVFKLDDAIGAVPVHGMTGAWGTLAVAFFAAPDYLVNGSRWQQFLIQGEGVLLAFAWAFGLSLVFFKILNLFAGGLRVSAEDELAGLNQAEHGATLGTGLVTARLLELAGGEADLSARLPDEPGDEAGELAYGFNALMDKVQTLVQGIAHNATSLSEAAETLTSVSHSMSRQSNETAVDADTVAEETGRVAKSVDGMTAAVNTVGNSAHGISLSTETMVQHIKRASSDSVNILKAISDIEEHTAKTKSVVETAIAETDRASSTMTQLDIAAQAIEGVLKLIQDIASRTELLALNATIEAARAGEMGKGFAVVAHEVKSLSTQTGKAVNSIYERITDIREGAVNAVDVVARIIEVIENINVSVLGISTAVGTQSEVTHKITESIQSAEREAGAVASSIETMVQTASEAAKVANHAAEGTQSVRDKITGVQAAAAEGAKQSLQVREAAEQVSTISGKLETLVGGLNGQVAAQQAS
jgi:Amt family ammonium transporter